MALVSIKGLRELDAALAELPARLAQKAVTDALTAGARKIAAEAKRRAPRDSGDLARSIVVRRKRNVRFVKGRGLRTVGASTVVVGFLRPWSRIAHLQEFGSRHQPARPFMRPAIDAQRGAVLETFQQRLAVAIEREALRLSKGKKA